MIKRIHKYPWLSLCTFGAFLVLCGLSYWQVQRLHWKQNLIQEIETALAAPPLFITRALQLQQLPEFRRVTVQGVLLHAESLHLQARYYKGNLGFNLITPLQFEDGAVIFINRGWIPKDYKTNPKIKISEPKGFIRITGILRGDEHPRSYLPQNDPGKGLWLWQDAAGWKNLLQRKMPNTAIIPTTIQQTRAIRKDDGFPIPQEAQFQLRNDHLQYALTWGSFAIILLVIYYLFTSPQKKKR